MEAKKEERERKRRNLSMFVKSGEIEESSDEEGGG